MKTAWRALLVRNLSRIPANISRIESITPQVSPLQPPNPPPWINFRLAHVSSAPAFEHRDHDQALIAEIISKPIGSNEIKGELKAQNPRAITSFLQSLDGNPEAARRFFYWVSDKESEKLRSKSYNIMLDILGGSGKPDEFWSLVEIMKKKGFGISKDTFLKVSERFSKDGMKKDLDLLKEMYFLNSHENVVGRMCPVVCKILRGEDNSEEIRNKLQDLGLDLSSDLVAAVLEGIGLYPKKALVFYKWVEGNTSFKIDGRVYNLMARVLGREDCIDDFWEVLLKMKSDGNELERETYVTVSGRFLTRRTVTRVVSLDESAMGETVVKVPKRFHMRQMITRAVDLYEFAMRGSVKPSLEDFIFLLRKTVCNKDLDLDLITRVVRAFVDAGNSVEGSTFAFVLKSLRSVCKLGECGKVLKAMEKGGFVPDNTIYNRVAVGLIDGWRLSEALEYIEDLEKSGSSPDLQVWTFLVRKHCHARELKSAISCFRKMVERKGGENVGSTFEALVNSLCRADMVEDAFKLLKEMATKKNLKPLHSTYKFLIEGLLRQGRVKEASTLLGSMKSHGFPPFVDPFLSYISKSGSVDDVMGFMKAITVKEFPSRAVFVRIFETLLRAGRHDVAHNVLSNSPGSVRNHADVLNLFYSMKLDETDVAAAI